MRWAVVLAVAIFAAGALAEDDIAVSQLDSSDVVASTKVPKSVTRAISHIKQDRSKSKRREKVTRVVKKVTKEEKHDSRKLRGKAVKALKKENKQDAKDAKKKKKKQMKKEIKKSERSKPAKGATKAWGTVIRKGKITAKEMPRKKKESKKTKYDDYSEAVRKGKKMKFKGKKPNGDCADCKRKCKTSACKSWCGMRWCGAVKGKTKKTAKRTECAKCNSMNKAAKNAAIMKWCKTNNCPM